MEDLVEKVDWLTVGFDRQLSFRPVGVLQRPLKQEAECNEHQSHRTKLLRLRGRSKALKVNDEEAFGDNC